MSEDDINEDEITEELEKGAKKVTVKHIFEDRRGLPQEMVENAEDTEKLKEKLQEREAQLAALALKHFNDRKDALLEKIPEEKREKAEEFIGENPNNLKMLEFEYTEDDLDDGTEPVPPKGKVKKYHKPTKNTVEELYDVLSSNQSTREEKKNANEQLDALWKKALADKKTVRKSLRGDD